MRKVTKVIKVYPFSELSEEAKKKAIEHLRDINTDFEWWYLTIDAFQELLDMIGLDTDGVHGIQFSGFSSQGDGLSFTGAYRYKKGCLAAVKKAWPKDTAIHEAVKAIQDAQKRCGYRVEGKIYRRDHRYVHENTVGFECDNAVADVGYYAEDDIIAAFRKIMKCFYAILEEDYYYRTGNEAIIETIEANEYEFTEDGKLFKEEN